MSEFDEGIDFEGGIFEDAGVDVAEIPDDPFGFGNVFWPLVVVSVEKPKVTGKKDKVGMMVLFAVDHPKYAQHQVGKQLGFGNWFQLPVPVAFQGQIPWDPQNNPKDQEAMVKLRRLFVSLGFGVDELPKVKPQMLVGKRCSAKISPKENGQGFWQFNLNNFRAITEDDDTGDWAASAPASNGGGMSAEEKAKAALEEEMRNA